MNVQNWSPMENMSKREAFGLIRFEGMFKTDFLPPWFDVSFC
jgi:hypothetical protein